MIRVAKSRLKQDLEWPLFAGTWLHILESTKVGVCKVVDERTGAVTISFDVKPVQTSCCLFESEVLDDLKPFRKIYNYAVKLAAVATHVALPI